MTKKLMCPMCAEGHLTRHSQLESITYKGSIKNIKTFFSECDFCGLEQAGAEEMKLNKRSVIKAKKEVDGLLSGNEILAIRERLGINQDKASRIFGGGPNAFTKYENDDVTQSEAMDKLIKVARDVPEAFDYLLQNSGLTNTSFKKTIQPKEFSAQSHFPWSTMPDKREENELISHARISKHSVYAVRKSHDAEWDMETAV